MAAPFCTQGALVMPSDRPRDEASERLPGVPAYPLADHAARFARQPQVEALHAVLCWARGRGFPPATLDAVRSVIVEFARDPGAPNLDLVMRSLRSRAVREARRAPRCGDAGR